MKIKLMKQSSSFPKHCVAFDATVPVDIDYLIGVLSSLKEEGRKFVGVTIHSSDAGYYHPKVDDEVVLMLEEDFFDSEFI